MTNADLHAEYIKSIDDKIKELEALLATGTQLPKQSNDSAWSIRSRLARAIESLTWLKNELQDEWP